VLHYAHTFITTSSSNHHNKEAKTLHNTNCIIDWQSSTTHQTTCYTPN